MKRKLDEISKDEEIENNLNFNQIFKLFYIENVIKFRKDLIDYCNIFNFQFEKIKKK